MESGSLKTTKDSEEEPQNNVNPLSDSNTINSIPLSQSPITNNPPINPALAIMPEHSVRKNSKKPMVIVMVIILLIILLALYSLSKATSLKITVNKPLTSATTSPMTLAPAQVNITSQGFSPSTITIHVNQAVVWTNQDVASHEVNSDPYPADNAIPNFNDTTLIAQNESYDYVFTTAGTYTYHDNLNPYSFKGTIVVKK